MNSILLQFPLFYLGSVALAANLTLVKEYAGTDFFNEWDYYGNYDDKTHGAVNYVNKSDSVSLAYVNPAGHAIIKVDNTSNVIWDYKRDSVRITTQDSFAVGTLWVIDALHLPFGCSVWPSIWTTGTDWPNNGEIDIIEGINTMTYNQMALHTREGCLASFGPDQTGKAGSNNCNATSGCTVIENTPNSFGKSFSDNGGGVFAAQYDVSGIYIWFWGRAHIPPAISTATDSIDISNLGPPSAAYITAESCDIGSYFGAQQLIVDITLCGDWAGEPTIYQQMCGGGPLSNWSCYNNNVYNNGTNPLHYGDAYFELQYIRAFAVNSSVVTSTNGSSGFGSSGSGSETSLGAGPTPSGGTPGNGAANQPSGAMNLSVGMSPARLYALVGALSVLGLAML